MMQKVAARTLLGMAITTILGYFIMLAIEFPGPMAIFVGWLVVSGVIGYTIDKIVPKD